MESSGGVPGHSFGGSLQSPRGARFEDEPDRSPSQGKGRERPTGPRSVGGGSDVGNMSDPLYPPRLAGDYLRALELHADLLRRIITRGWEDLVAIANAEPSPAKDVLLPLYRHLLECADGVCIMVAQGQAEAIQPVLRSAVEAEWAIEYILSADSERRARQYRANDLIQRRNALRKISTGAPTAATDERLSRVESLLDHEPMLSVVTEWEAQPRRRPNWYSLFKGPQNLRELAEALGRAEWYNNLYSPLSRFAHATGSLDATSVDADGTGHLLGPRSPDHIQELASLAMSIALAAANKMIRRFAPDRHVEFQEWYRPIREMRDAFAKRPPIVLPE